MTAFMLLSVVWAATGMTLADASELTPGYHTVVKPGAPKATLYFPGKRPTIWYTPLGPVAAEMASPVLTPCRNAWTVISPTPPGSYGDVTVPAITPPTPRGATSLGWNPAADALLALASRADEAEERPGAATGAKNESGADLVTDCWARTALKAKVKITAHRPTMAASTTAVTTPRGIRGFCT
jgi:hypothetical protein